MRVLFHERLGSAARLGYSFNASPARYGVRSWHLLLRNAGTIGTSGRVIVHIKSGRSLFAWTVAHLALNSPNGRSVTLILALIALLTACHAVFSLSGSTGLLVWSVTLMSPP